MRFLAIVLAKTMPSDAGLALIDALLRSGRLSRCFRKSG